MGKRKRLKSPERQAETESIEEHTPSAPAPARQCYMFTLPDDILCDILFWTRPENEDDQSIWLWLCHVSGTCRVFRRLVRLEKKGVAPLMPTVFEFYDTYYYSKHEAPSDFHRRFWYGPVDLRVKLMDTVRNSDWMWSKITSICVSDSTLVEEGGNRPSMAVVLTLKNLLTSSCFPNLLDLQIDLVDLDLEDLEGFTLIDESFLSGMAREHSGLRRLHLMNLENNRPDAFAALSASLQCLEEVQIGVYDTMDEAESVVPSNRHLSAFLADLNPNLRSLTMEFSALLDKPGDEGFSRLPLSCPNLKSLTIVSRMIRTSTIARIIRSKRSLVSIAFNECHRDTNDEGVIDAIVDMKLRLETFQARFCHWFNDSGLMRLLEYQIDAFDGRAVLTMLEITGTKVTPAGLRSFLARWIETNPVLELKIYFDPYSIEYIDDDDEFNEMKLLTQEFPDVFEPHF